MPQQKKDDDSPRMERIALIRQGFNPMTKSADNNFVSYTQKEFGNSGTEFYRKAEIVKRPKET